MLHGSASIAELPAGAGFGLLPQMFALALLSLPLLLRVMSSGLIFTATLMLAVVWSLEKAPGATQLGRVREKPDPLPRGIAVSLTLLCSEGREKFRIQWGLAESPAQHLAEGLSR